jgi:membrane protein DedA with SNARE-associated domain
MATMKSQLRTYTAYSIGSGVVWTIILIFASFAASASKRETLLLVCFGWAIGWLSATIARAVYPPPKSRQQKGPTAG